MTDRDEFDLELRKRLNGIVERKLARYVRRVITRIKRLPENCCLSGQDSDLENVWEEWKYQIQHSRLIYFDAYEEAIEGICRAVACSTRREDCELIRMQRDAFVEWVYEDARTEPSLEDLQDCVTEKLIARIWALGADEELKVDPWDEIARAQMDEEIQLMEGQEQKDDNLDH